MDFHSLTRRELQAFCKKNKIPANMTNAAMADALKALEIVEGIEEFMQTSQSETLEGSEVTSPYVPPTAGRNTHRRNVVKEELESVTLTSTRRTARKTATKDADESQVDTVETPAVVAQSGRRKVQMSTACRKMDSDLKECVEEEKKDDSMTPAAPLGVASRRKVQMPYYSTRRSVRLAGKSVQMVNDVESEGSELFKNEELTKDSEEGQEVNQKEGLNDCNGVEEAIAIVENYESEVKSEVVEVQPDNTEYVSDEVQQSEGSVIEISVEENSEEKDIEIVAGDSVEHVLLESEDNFAVDEVSHDEVFCDDAEQELHDGKDAISSEDVLVKLTELKLQQEDAQVVKMEGGCADADSDLIDHLAVPEEIMKTEPDEMETLQLEESKQSADQEPNIEEEAGNAVASVKNSPSKQLSGVEDAPPNAASTKIAERIPNKSSAIKSMTDNKENNISNGSKMVILNEIIKPAKDSGDDNLEEMSLRKLTKMFKEKLEITKKTSKHGNEAALPRPALQVLPENRLIDGNEK